MYQADGAGLEVLLLLLDGFYPSGRGEFLSQEMNIYGNNVFYWIIEIMYIMKYH